MTAPLPAVRSLAEIAQALGETERYVTDKCRRREWPHLRGARGRISFTDEQFAQILELIAQAPAADGLAPRLSFAPRSRRRAS